MADAPTKPDSVHHVFHAGAELSFEAGTIVKRFRRDQDDWLLIVPPHGDAYLIDPRQRLIALEPEFDSGPYRI